MSTGSVISATRYTSSPQSPTPPAGAQVLIVAAACGGNATHSDQGNSANPTWRAAGMTHIAGGSYTPSGTGGSCGLWRADVGGTGSGVLAWSDWGAQVHIVAFWLKGVQNAIRDSLDGYFDCGAPGSHALSSLPGDVGVAVQGCNGASSSHGIGGDLSTEVYDGTNGEQYAYGIAPAGSTMDISLGTGNNHNGYYVYATVAVQGFSGSKVRKMLSELWTRRYGWPVPPRLIDKLFGDGAVAI